jgi:hypothetical protein
VFFLEFWPYYIAPLLHKSSHWYKWIALSTYLGSKVVTEVLNKKLSYYMPILMYGTETWMWTKADISRLMATEMRFLRVREGKTETE